MFYNINVSTTFLMTVTLFSYHNFLEFQNKTPRNIKYFYIIFSYTYMNRNILHAVFTQQVYTFGDCNKQNVLNDK